jgi:hypothetical protein
MMMALPNAVGRHITLSMPNESEACPDTIIVTEVELDHFIFHMERMGENSAVTRQCRFIRAIIRISIDIF